MPEHNHMLEQGPPPAPPGEPQVVTRAATVGPSAAQTFWGSDVKFTNMGFRQLGFMWAMCALKVAYTDTTAVYDLFKDKIGADSIDVSQPGTDVRTPKLMRIDYPGDVIFVVRGTTLTAQWDYFRSSRIGLAKTNGSWFAMNPSAVAPSDLSNMGALYEPFVVLGESLWNSILSVITGSGYTKRIHFVGHSLGAALIDLILLRFAHAGHARFAYYHDDAPAVNWSTQTSSTGALNAYVRKFYDSFNFAYLIGEPFLGRFMSKYVGRDPSTGAVVNMDPRRDGSRVDAWPFPYGSTRTAHLRHRYDPVCFVPDEESPRANAVAEALQPFLIPMNGPLFRNSTDYRPTFRMEDERRTLSPIKINFWNRDEILARLEKYHAIGQYLRMYSNGLYEQEPGAPTVWSDLVSWALSLGGDMTAPAF